jgi:Mrp family chromosome partitioning ATPase
MVEVNGLDRTPRGCSCHHEALAKAFLGLSLAAKNLAARKRAFYRFAMATIIGVISQKGGVGKSTLSRALAREAAVSGLKVKLADLDTQQGTSSNWHLRRLDAGIEPVFSVEAFKTAGQALRAANGYELMVLDGAARARAC